MSVSKKIIALVVLMLCVGSVAPQEPREVSWWEGRTWYLLFVRSFYDSDGDGVGDFRGIAEKLDYLQDLGIGGIWLMPITESTSYHGYDTEDYYDVEQDYGTMEDFQYLLAEARQRDIKIIMDLVINHTSSQHEWFLESTAGGSPYDEWYVWRDEDPRYNGPWGQPAWYREGERYYYAPFWSEMPDLNFDNPEVTDEMLSIAEFWLDEVGVDGFRLDAVKYLLEQEVEGRNILQNTPSTRQWLTRFNEFTKRINPEAFVIGEVWDDTFIVARYTNENAIDAGFEFRLAEAMLTSIRSRNKRAVQAQITTVLGSFEDSSQFAPFLSNHDQDRVMTLLEGNVEANKALASAMLTLPGAPFLYYGEEIGMMGGKPDENIRRPMQWDTTPVTGGFTTGTPWQPLAQGLEETTVANQLQDPSSLLNHYRSLIALRNSTPTLVTGETLILASRPSAIHAILRHDANGKYLVIINLGNRELTDYAISSAGIDLAPVTSLNVVFGAGDIAPLSLSETGDLLDYLPKTLSPYETLILRLD